jgi:hypothetical protein
MVNEQINESINMSRILIKRKGELRRQLEELESEEERLNQSLNSEIQLLESIMKKEQNFIIDDNLDIKLSELINFLKEFVSDEVYERKIINN